MEDSFLSDFNNLEIDSNEKDRVIPQQSKFDPNFHLIPVRKPAFFLFVHYDLRDHSDHRHRVIAATLCVIFNRLRGLERKNTWHFSLVNVESGRYFVRCDDVRSLSRVVIACTLLSHRIGLGNAFRAGIDYGTFEFTAFGEVLSKWATNAAKRCAYVQSGMISVSQTALTKLRNAFQVEISKVALSCTLPNGINAFIFPAHCFSIRKGGMNLMNNFVNAEHVSPPVSSLEVFGVSADISGSTTKINSDNPLVVKQLKDDVCCLQSIPNYLHQHAVGDFDCWYRGDEIVLVCSPYESFVKMCIRIQDLFGGHFRELLDRVRFVIFRGTLHVLPFPNRRLSIRWGPALEDKDKMLAVAKKGVYGFQMDKKRFRTLKESNYCFSCTCHPGPTVNDLVVVTFSAPQVLGGHFMEDDRMEDGQSVAPNGQSNDDIDE